MTKIEWTDRTWNPITGCTKISEGCRNCYAEVMAKRLQAMGQEKYKNGFQITLHEDALQEPFKWKKPCKIFVCSMSDLFQKEVPLCFMNRVMDTILKTPQHIYQILTKRPERMANYFLENDIYLIKNPKNIWIGTTVENQKAKIRIDFLRSIKNSIKFLSCEPLLEDLGELDLEGIDWVIVGGESGHNARPVQKEWVLNIQRQCEEQKVPFFFKQWGGKNKHKTGSLLEGKEYKKFPNLKTN